MFVFFFNSQFLLRMTIVITPTPTPTPQGPKILTTACTDTTTLLQLQQPTTGF